MRTKTMTKNTADNINSICTSLEVLGQQRLADEVRGHSATGMVSLEDLSVIFESSAARFSNERFERYLRRSKVGTPLYLHDILDIPERNLDLEYMEQLSTLGFISNKNNLLIWGSSGTGKTWTAKMLATTACSKGLRTRWVTFPALYDQLYRLSRSTDGQPLEGKLAYYSRFDLLCIDEFPNVSDMDPLLVQQIFNYFSEAGTTMLMCMQCQPEKLDELFSIKSIGQSIRGRILQGAKRLHMTGPDLRMLSSSEL